MHSTSIRSESPLVQDVLLRVPLDLEVQDAQSCHVMPLPVYCRSSNDCTIMLVGERGVALRGTDGVS